MKRSTCDKQPHHARQAPTPAQTVLKELVVGIPRHVTLLRAIMGIHEISADASGSYRFTLISAWPTIPEELACELLEAWQNVQTVQV